MKTNLNEQLSHIKKLMGVLNEQPSPDETFDSNNMVQANEDTDSYKLKHELMTIDELVDNAIGNSLSRNSVREMKDDIQADWISAHKHGLGDVYDFVNEYLKDWVRDARSESPSGFESGSRLTSDENGTIWGSDWESVIDRATERPNMADDDMADDDYEDDVNHYQMPGFEDTMGDLDKLSIRK